MERLCWEAREGCGREPPSAEAAEQRSVLQSEEELQGDGNSKEGTVEGHGEDEGDEKVSDTLLQELWKLCRGKIEGKILKYNILKCRE